MKQIESIKIGRLRFTIARKINRKCADIYLSSNYQKHIERRHKKELNYTAGIDLSLSGDHWEVKTAEPRRREDIEKRKLLWEKQHTFSANRRRSLP